MAKIFHRRFLYYFWLNNDFHFEFYEDFSITLVSKNHTFPSSESDYFVLDLKLSLALFSLNPSYMVRFHEDAYWPNLMSLFTAGSEHY